MKDSQPTDEWTTTLDYIEDLGFNILNVMQVHITPQGVDVVCREQTELGPQEINHHFNRYQ